MVMLATAAVNDAGGGCRRLAAAAAAGAHLVAADRLVEVPNRLGQRCLKPAGCGADDRTSVGPAEAN